MRYLLISISFLIFGCTSYPKKNNFKNTDVTGQIYNPYFSNQNQDYVYKATIEVYGNSFGGVFIVKKTGEHKHRVAMITEMGKKLFDFSFDKNSFNVNYILDDLNKKVLINILKRDFRVLVTERFSVTKSFTLNLETIKETIIDNKKYYYFGAPKLTKIIRANTKEKVQFLFREISNTVSKEIIISHANIKLKIKLNSISR